MPGTGHSLSPVGAWRRSVPGGLSGVHAHFRRAASRDVPSKAMTPAQKIGLRFEKTVCDYLTRTGTFIDGVHFEFLLQGRLRRAIPDGLLFDQELNRCTVVEVKQQHTEQAFEQLQIYQMLVQYWWPGPVNTLEVCAHYHPNVVLPQRKVLVEDPQGAVGEEYYVWPVTARRLRLMGDSNGTVHMV